ncbi:hypothetical protein [Streptomonospora litoralis]|uniref:hypothetical protein n=1 Tax=Streptomonospora litoralis TaxID=2498135 RepID=UPI001035D837|nr:hypothetical protein [Streptomonospora litoralis]
MNNSVTELADRISSFTFTENPDRQWSQIALFEEYLRRAALWLGVESDVRWPFGDFAAAVDSSVRADDRLVRQVDESIPLDQSQDVVDTCLNALHFQALRESGTPLPRLPDPFEPLLLMYERGNGVYSTQIYFQIGASGVKKRSPEYFASADPVTVLDPEALDAIDSRSS